MESLTKAKQIGGSIYALIPKELVSSERIHIDDTLKIKVEKVDNMDFLWGRFKGIKKPAKQIMKEIDEGELGG